MASEHLIFLSVPGLRPGDIDEGAAPTLHGWASRGVLAELAPTFPCVTSPVQASMLTGTAPRDHGVIANGFYYRERSQVEFWVAPNDMVTGEQTWDALRTGAPGPTSAVWHAQNIKGAGANFIVTPSPIHEADGTTKLWCYSKPEGTYQAVLDDLGHFPLQHYWGPLANIESTKWILDAAAWLIDRHAPNYHWIYIPHLDYASQKFGPNSDQAKAAVAELDTLLGAFAERVARSPIGADVVYLVAGEYALTDVHGVVFPNRILRQAGLLTVVEAAGAEQIDLTTSPAFAMVDHQFAHVFVKDSSPQVCSRIVELFRGMPGIATAVAGNDRAALGMDHPRCGDVVLVTDDAHWLAYYWWVDDAAAPPYARTVDIHAKPGYDPVEMFFDPATKGISLDATLVRGSHGVPATAPRHRTALICSTPSTLITPGGGYRDTDIKRISLGLLGV